MLLKDYQQDPVTREMLHADFIDVRENEQVKVKVPLVLVGKAVGAADGGLLTQIRRELEVYALPGGHPGEDRGGRHPPEDRPALHINDIKLPAGVTVKSNVNYTIAVVSAPENEEVPAAAAAAVPAAGAAAAPAAGAAAAGDAKAADGKGAAAAKAAPAKAPAKK